MHPLDAWRKSLSAKMHVGGNTGTNVYYLNIQAMSYRFECILCRLIQRCWQQSRVPTYGLERVGQTAASVRYSGVGHDCQENSVFNSAQHSRSSTCAVAVTRQRHGGCVRFAAHTRQRDFVSAVQRGFPRI
jgi:hypothetical protein